MTSQDHAHYFARRERQCRALAQTHDDPFLRRIYEKFADNYAKALIDKDRKRPQPRAAANGNHGAAPAERQRDPPVAGR